MIPAAAASAGPAAGPVREPPGEVRRPHDPQLWYMGDTSYADVPRAVIMPPSEAR